MSDKKLVMCPYDEVHKVKENRLQLHITKCRQNHLNDAKFICPFNATHVFPFQERDYHVSRCPDRAPLDRLVTEGIHQNNPYGGRTAVPSYHESPPVVSEEVWDIDPIPGAGYRPPTELPANAMFMPPPNSKPAERRRMYQNLHLRADPEQTKPPTSVYASPVQPSPKQPTGASRAERENNLSLGRGSVGPNRIAANIFNTQRPSSQASNGTSFATISPSLVGRGRGMVKNPPPAFLHDDDFPALGGNAGMGRASRSASSYAGSVNGGNK